MDALRARVLADAPRKRLYGVDVDGPALVGFASALHAPDATAERLRGWGVSVTRRYSDFEWLHRKLYAVASPTERAP